MRLFGGEVVEDAFAAEDVFDVDDFHLEVVAADETAGEVDVLFAVLVELGLFGEVLDGGGAEDAAGFGEG